MYLLRGVEGWVQRQRGAGAYHENILTSWVLRTLNIDIFATTLFVTHSLLTPGSAATATMP